MKNASTLRQTNLEGIYIRKVPYPYKAILAICSDLDETPDKNVYFEIMRFMNTEDETSMGRGVGLEIGNTLYFNMPEDQFAYWNTDEEGRRFVRELIHSGHIDCIHSFGDLAKTRENAEINIRELVKHNCNIKVWVDHAQAISNIGSDIMEGAGADVSHQVYHSDLLHSYGVRYIWIGRITSVIGQNVKRSYKGIISGNLLGSFKTVLKQVVKDALGTMGYRKYAMHKGNRLIRNSVMDDGNKVIEFIRANPFWGGVDECATADGFSQVMTERYLSQLVKSGGMSILYTHLGKINNHKKPFNENTVNAFRLLKKYYTDNNILVTTTRRMLDYCSLQDNSTIEIKDGRESIELNINCDAGTSDLQGFSISSQYDKRHEILLNGSERYEMDKIGKDSEGRFIFQIPWKRLSYPELT
jgi:hypothetical protein